MLSIFASLIGVIPGLENLAASWHASALEAQVKILQAKTGADRDTAIALLQANAQVQTRWWFVALLPVMWAIPFVFYTWKGVFFDNVLAILFGECNAKSECVLWGVANTTPALGGTFATIFLMIVTFYFAHGMKQS